MSGDTVVSVAFLRRAAEMLLDHVAEVAGDEIALDADDFWSIPSESRYVVSHEPAELTIGQLSESLDFLERTVERGDSLLAHDLNWLADIMRAIGDQIPG